MSKGKLIGISGRIQTRNYEGKDGIKRYVTEIVADEVQFLERSDNSNTTPNNNNYDDGWNDPVDDSEEVPF